MRVVSRSGVQLGFGCPGPWQGVVPPALVFLALVVTPALADMRIVAGDGEAGFSDGRAARFHKPIRLAPFGADAVVVADIYNHAVRLVTLTGEVTTLAGAPDRKAHRDGNAAEAAFASPHGIAVSADGRIAVAEAENHTVRLMAADGSGEWTVSTLAGVPGEEGFRDGPADQALFRSPHAVVWTADGALLVADIGNARIRRIGAGMVSTVAGSGESGRADGPAEVARFVYPMDIALSGDDDLLIADAGNHLIRRWRFGEGVDTLQLSRELATPHGIAVGGDGTVYVAEMNAHKVVAIDSEGVVRTVCGTGKAGASNVQLARPAAVLVHAGGLWVADLDNHRIVFCSLDSS